MVWLFTAGCLVGYIAGLFLLVGITPGLVTRAFDDALFIGVAAVAIFGAMLSFGAIGVIYSVANGALAARILDALLLIIQGATTLRTGLRTLRPRYDSNPGSYRTSRIMAGSFFLALTVACAVVLVLLVRAS